MKIFAHLPGLALHECWNVIRRASSHITLSDVGFGVCTSLAPLIGTNHPTITAVYYSAAAFLGAYFAQTAIDGVSQGRGVVLIAAQPTKAPVTVSSTEKKSVQRIVPVTISKDAQFLLPAGGIAAVMIVARKYPTATLSVALASLATKGIIKKSHENDDFHEDMQKVAAASLIGGGWMFVLSGSLAFGVAGTVFFAAFSSAVIHLQSQKEFVDKIFRTARQVLMWQPAQGRLLPIVIAEWAGTSKGEGAGSPSDVSSGHTVAMSPESEGDSLDLSAEVESVRGEEGGMVTPPLTPYAGLPAGSVEVGSFASCLDTPYHTLAATPSSRGFEVTLQAILGQAGSCAAGDIGRQDSPHPFDKRSDASLWGRSIIIPMLDMTSAAGDRGQEGSPTDLLTFGVLPAIGPAPLTTGEEGSSAQGREVGDNGSVSEQEAGDEKGSVATVAQEGIEGVKPKAQKALDKAKPIEEDTVKESDGKEEAENNAAPEDQEARPAIEDGGAPTASLGKGDEYEDAAAVATSSASTEDRADRTVLPPDVSQDLAVATGGAVYGRVALRHVPFGRGRRTAAEGGEGVVYDRGALRHVSDSEVGGGSAATSSVAEEAEQETGVSLDRKGRVRQAVKKLQARAGDGFPCAPVVMGPRERSVAEALAHRQEPAREHDSRLPKKVFEQRREVFESSH